MAKNCTLCGKAIGGILGLAEANPEDIKQLKDAGVDIQEPICYACSVPYSSKLKSITAEREESVQENLKDMVVCTVSPYPHTEYKILGIASAYIALGTGPINQLLSSISDFFGEQSESYNAKMQEAEAACLQKLKRRAAEMGANAVIGLNTTYSELTHGHGMLLVCMNGTAIKMLS